MRQLDWNDLGDARAGRPNLGPYTTVLSYRLLLLSLKEAMDRKLGTDHADRLVKQGGEMAGQLVYSRLLSQSDSLFSLVRELSHFFKANNVAILRMEEADEEEMRFVFTIRESLEGPLSPASSQAETSFDEGFLTGVLSRFYGRRVEARVVECWGREQRVCRYEARAEPQEVLLVSADRNSSSVVAA